MINLLASTLKAILDNARLPGLLYYADVAFESPAYKPSKARINLFLYDVRENVELRTNEPVIQRRNGMWPCECF